jgi:hypothetical protein
MIEARFIVSSLCSAWRERKKNEAEIEDTQSNGKACEDHRFWQVYAP